MLRGKQPSARSEAEESHLGGHESGNLPFRVYRFENATGLIGTFMRLTRSLQRHIHLDLKEIWIRKQLKKASEPEIYQLVDAPILIIDL